MSKKSTDFFFSWQCQELFLFLAFEGKKVFLFPTSLIMNKIALEIKDILYSQSSNGAYVLILADKHSSRRLPIVIGTSEAQAIAVGLEGKQPSRPLTYDLFKRFALHYDIDLTEVVITHFLDGVFYSTLICKQGDDISMIDARPSDAIALAVRFNCPISAYESVMNEAGIEMEEENAETTHPEPAEEIPDDSLDSLTLEQLQQLLEIAIDEEDYEKAAELRDLINSKT